MKVIINTIPLLTPLTGVGRYTYYLAYFLRKLYPNLAYSYYIGYVTDSLPQPVLENTHVTKKSRIKSIIQKMPFSNFIKEMVYSLSAFFLRDRYDVYIEPNFIPVKGLRAKKIIAVIYDFSFHLYPEWHPVERVKFFSKNFWREIKRADTLVFVSHTTMSQALELGISSTNMAVIYPGIDHSIFRPLSAEEIQQFEMRLKLPERFILYVGTLEPRKNLATLISAYLKLPEYLKKSFPLVIAGFKGWKNREILDSISRNNLIYLGYVSDRELCYLYNRATLLVYPSLYEGFGFPPLEAMACSCPVLVSDIPVFREVYGEFATYFDPSDPEALSGRLEDLLTKEDALLTQRRLVRKRALMYNWETCVTKFFDLMSM